MSNSTADTLNGNRYVIRRHSIYFDYKGNRCDHEYCATSKFHGHFIIDKGRFPWAFIEEIELFNDDKLPPETRWEKCHEEGNISVWRRQLYVPRNRMLSFMRWSAESKEKEAARRRR